MVSLYIFVSKSKFKHDFLLRQALRNQVTIRPPAQDASGAPVPGQSVLAGQQHQATPQTIPRRPGDQLIEKLRVVHRELAMQQRLTKNINVSKP